MKKHVIFDLDGTLTDSGPGIRNGIRYMQEKEGLRPLTDAELDSCIGPPMAVSFPRLWGVSQEEALRLVYIYREYYSDKGIFENAPYEGIPELLSALCESGFSMAVCSSKPQFMVETVLEHFDLSHFFTLLRGSSAKESAQGKEESLRETVRVLGGACVMVGDRADDVRAAAFAQIPVLGALWGYSVPGELTSAGADLLAHTPQEAFSKVKALFR